MMPCREVVRLISSNEELPFVKKAELRMHLMMCKHCSRYSKHLAMLGDGFKKLFGAKTQVDAADLETLEKKIIEEVVKKKF